MDTSSAPDPAAAPTVPRYRGWARDLSEARALQDAARPSPAATDGLLAGVRYVHLDYHREQFTPHLLGVGHPREITDAVELADPPWRREGPDTVDHGLQLDLTDGRSLSVSWDLNSSDHEGVGVAWTPFFDGGWLTRDAPVAVWRVESLSEHWKGLLNSELVDVELGFSADRHGLHCHHVALTFPSALIHITLGDYVGDDHIASGDNLLVYRT